MSTHIQTCTTPCALCGMKLLTQKVEEHQSTCDKYTVTCETIKYETKRDGEGDEKKNDDEREIKGCGQAFYRRDLEAHQLRDCPKALIACPFGCTGKRIRRESLREHEKDAMLEHLRLLSSNVIALKHENAELKKALSFNRNTAFVGNRSNNGSVTKCRLYVMGGLDKHDQITTSVYGWDGTAWNVFASLPQHTTAAVYRDTKIYAFGRSGVSVFDTVTLCWELLPDWNIRTNVSHNNVVCVNDCVYFLGDKFGSYSLNTGELLYEWFDASHHKAKVAMLDPTSTTRILLFGCKDYQGQHQRATKCYDISTRACTILTPATHNRHWFQAVATQNGKIWILGGGSIETQKLTDVVEEYDPMTDTW